MSPPSSDHEAPGDIPPSGEPPLPSAEGQPVPQPDSETPSKAKGGCATTALTGAIGAAGLWIAGVFLTPCVGATRAAQLKWTKQQQDAAARIAQIESMRAAAQQNTTEPTDLDESSHE